MMRESMEEVLSERLKIQDVQPDMELAHSNGSACESPGTTSSTESKQQTTVNVPS